MDPLAIALPPDPLERALATVRARAGVDLRQHRRATLERRLAIRVVQSGARSVADYLRLLEADAAEPETLLGQLTVKVSRFFRDPPLHDVLEAAVLPALADRRGPLRVWVAGCARGEEPYSVAMTLAAARGTAGVAITATDVDRAALAAARAATYRAADLACIPPAHRARFTEPAPAGFRIRAELARAVTFARHDLASATRVAGGAFDVVACRNVLIYFDRPLQEAVLELLLAHLPPGGFLCLGHAEWPTPAAAARLAVVDRRARVFRKGP